MVDPNRDGYVSLQEYMAFMISKETENVQSSEEIEKAFRAITAGDRPYVTKEELYAVRVFFCGFVVDSLTVFFSESYKGDGRLLHNEDEALRGTENGTTHRRCFGLHRVHKNPLPKLIILKIYSQQIKRKNAKKNNVLI